MCVYISKYNAHTRKHTHPIVGYSCAVLSYAMLCYAMLCYALDRLDPLIIRAAAIRNVPLLFCFAWRSFADALRAASHNSLPWYVHSRSLSSPLILFCGTISRQVHCGYGRAHSLVLRIIDAERAELRRNYMLMLTNRVRGPIATRTQPPKASQEFSPTNAQVGHDISRLH